MSDCKPRGFFKYHNGEWQQTSYRSLAEWEADKANFAPCDWDDTPPTPLYDESAVSGLAFALAERQNCLNQVDAENKRLREKLSECATILNNAPGLPLEIMDESHLSKWTDAIGALCVVLNDEIGALIDAGKEKGK